MTKKARFTQGQITKVLRASVSAGMIVDKVIIEVDGTIKMEFGPEPKAVLKAAPRQLPWKRGPGQGAG